MTTPALYNYPLHSCDPIAGSTKGF
jgi:hypothetical protein